MLRITRIILRRSLDELSGSQDKNIGVLNSLNGRFVGLGEFDHFPRRVLYVPVSEVADDRSATNLQLTTTVAISKLVGISIRFWVLPA